MAQRRPLTQTTKRVSRASCGTGCAVGPLTVEPSDPFRGYLTGVGWEHADLLAFRARALAQTPATLHDDRTIGAACLHTMVGRCTRRLRTVPTSRRGGVELSLTARTHNATVPGDAAPAFPTALLLASLHARCGESSLDARTCTHAMLLLAARPPGRSSRCCIQKLACQSLHRCTAPLHCCCAALCAAVMIELLSAVSAWASSKSDTVCT